MHKYSLGFIPLGASCCSTLPCGMLKPEAGRAAAKTDQGASVDTHMTLVKSGACELVQKLSLKQAAQGQLVALIPACSRVHVIPHHCPLFILCPLSCKLIKRPKLI